MDRKSMDRVAIVVKSTVTALKVWTKVWTRVDTKYGQLVFIKKGE